MEKKVMAFLVLLIIILVIVLIYSVINKNNLVEDEIIKNEVTENVIEQEEITESSEEVEEKTEEDVSSIEEDSSMKITATAGREETYGALYIDDNGYVYYNENYTNSKLAKEYVEILTKDKKHIKPNLILIQAPSTKNNLLEDGLTSGVRYTLLCDDGTYRFDITEVEVKTKNATLVDKNGMKSYEFLEVRDPFGGHTIDTEVTLKSNKKQEFVDVISAHDVKTDTDLIADSWHMDLKQAEHKFTSADRNAVKGNGEELIIHDFSGEKNKLKFNFTYKAPWNKKDIKGEASFEETLKYTYKDGDNKIEFNFEDENTIEINEYEKGTLSSTVKVFE